MTAIGVRKYGGPEVLEQVELGPEPLAANQVRVRVTAATVNPTDTVLRSGARAKSPTPDSGVAVPGMDAAGRIAEVGEGVSGLAIGDAVMGVVLPQGQHGGYREDLVLPARSVTHIPDGCTVVEAATLPMNGLTAVAALEGLALRPGQVLAVTGAAGAFGGYVIQLAKHAGLHVIADAAPADEELVRQLGADEVVPRGADVAQRIQEARPSGVDGLADGAVQGEAVLPAIRDGGALATVRFWKGNGERSIRTIPVMVADWAQEWEQLDRLRALVEDEALTLRVADSIPAAQAAEAHRRLEAGGVRGRLVLRFN